MDNSDGLKWIANIFHRFHPENYFNGAIDTNFGFLKNIGKHEKILRLKMSLIKMTLNKGFK